MPPPGVFSLQSLLRQGTIGPSPAVGTPPKESPPVKRSLHLFSLAALLALGGSVRAADEEKAGPKDNKPPEGFTALFNGKDLTNWKGLITIKDRAKLSKEELATRQEVADKKAFAHWKVQNGLL